MDWLIRLLRKNFLEISAFKNKKGKWQWHIKGANGEILCHSEEYKTKAGCNKTIDLILEKMIIRAKDE